MRVILFFVWLSLLSTAWTTRHLLRTSELVPLAENVYATCFDKTPNDHQLAFVVVNTRNDATVVTTTNNNNNNSIHVIGSHQPDAAVLARFRSLQNESRNAELGDCCSFIVPPPITEINTERMGFVTFEDCSVNADAVTFEALARSLNNWHAAIDGKTVIAKELRYVKSPCTPLAPTIAPDNMHMIAFGDIEAARNFFPNTAAANSIVAVAFLYVDCAEVSPMAECEKFFIKEWDILMNTRHFRFGDAAVNTAFMDLESVLTHEFGHAGGVGHAAVRCKRSTMHPTVHAGEIEKRGLSVDDTNCFRALHALPPMRNCASFNSLSVGAVIVWTFFIIIV